MPRPRATTAPPPADLHPADRAVRLRNRSGLPADQHPAFDAVVAAFDRYEAGDDEAARAALQTVGLGSPFLEWKLLLRGLMAYSAGDDQRAVQNWQRLDPARLPAKLAAPVRAAVDPAFAVAQPEKVRSAQTEQYRKLALGPLAETLAAVRKEIARGKSLTAAFRHSHAALPRLRELAPRLVPRLATAFYRAILDHGEPADLTQYRLTFGEPPDDPKFHKLEAQANEDAGHWAEANRHWAAYEAWLATAPPGWPADLARRARATVLHRMGRNAQQQADASHRELHDLFEAYFARDRRPKAPPADPAKFWQQAAVLAPDWVAPAQDLFHRLISQGKAEDAEAVARTLLKHRPNALPVVDALAGQVARQGRAADAYELRTKALAANPLDQRLRVLTAHSALGLARRLLIDGDSTAAERVLTESAGLCEEHTPTGWKALGSVVARKLRRPADADRLRDEALTVPGGRLAATFFLAVDALLAKLKPAERKPLDAALAEAFAGPATPLEANLLYAAWDQYHLEGVSYRGQKTQEKKVEEVIVRSAESAAPEIDFENLARGVAMRQEWKRLAKLAAPLRARFPNNPVFPLLLAEMEFTLADGLPRPHKVAGLLRAALAAAERSPEPRHKDLLPRIKKLQHDAVHPAYFDDFFGADPIV